MQFSEAQQWLKTFGVKCHITEETWQKMDEQTRSVFMSDARMVSEPADIVSRMRALEADHKPDGWPAVQMRDISTLCDLVKSERERIAELTTGYEAANGFSLVDKGRLEYLITEDSRLRAENARLKRELSNAIG